MPTKIEADFRADLAEYWRKELQRIGNKVPADADINTIGKMYFNVAHKAIEPRPRCVHQSKELGDRVLRSELQEGLNRIMTAAEDGRDLIPFLSDKVLKGDWDDLLANDWGIQHFHLGKPGKGHFVSRTTELLFAWADRDDLYLLNVLDHKAFNTTALMTILYRNWPRVLEPFELKGVKLPTKPFTDNEIGALRNTGIQPMLQIDGKAFISPGGGIAGTGVGTRVMHQLGAALHRVNAMEREALKQAEDVAAQIEKEIGKPPSKVYVRLVYRDDGWKYRFDYDP